MNDLQKIGLEITQAYTEGLRNLPEEIALASISTSIMSYAIFKGVSYYDVIFTLVDGHNRVMAKEGGDTN